MKSFTTYALLVTRFAVGGLQTGCQNSFSGHCPAQSAVGALGVSIACRKWSRVGIGR